MGARSLQPLCEALPRFVGGEGPLQQDGEVRSPREGCSAGSIRTFGWLWKEGPESEGCVRGPLPLPCCNWRCLHLVLVLPLEQAVLSQRQPCWLCAAEDLPSASRLLCLCTWPLLRPAGSKGCGGLTSQVSRQKLTVLVPLRRPFGVGIEFN